VLHADVALAERYAAAAFDAYRAREYERAISLYQQALAAAPSTDILYNIARVYDAGLRDRRAAIEYYERYRAHPRATPELFETATRRLAELRAAEAATSPVPSGSADTITREFPGDTPARLPAAPVSTPTDRGLQPLEVTALAFGAAGLVGIGLGIGFGLSARAEEDTWGRDCNGNQCNSQRGVDAAEAAARSASVATAGFAVGGGLLAVSALLWLIDSDNEQPSAAVSLRVEPALGTSSLGGTLSGQF
jgi:tetratricopeptide (TPR) repeat protein